MGKLVLNRNKVEKNSKTGREFSPPAQTALPARESHGSTRLHPWPPSPPRHSVVVTARPLEAVGRVLFHPLWCCCCHRAGLFAVRLYPNLLPYCLGEAVPWRSWPAPPLPLAPPPHRLPLPPPLRQLATVSPSHRLSFSPASGNHGGPPCVWLSPLAHRPQPSRSVVPPVTPGGPRRRALPSVFPSPTRWRRPPGGPPRPHVQC